MKKPGPLKLPDFYIVDGKQKPVTVARLMTSPYMLHGVDKNEWRIEFTHESIMWTPDHIKIFREWLEKVEAFIKETPDSRKYKLANNLCWHCADEPCTCKGN